LVKVLKKGLAVIFIALAFIVGIQNPTNVDVNLLIVRSTLPLATLMSICFIIGVVFGYLVSIKAFSSLKWQNYKLKRDSHNHVVKSDN
jgi:lipopolysaccharide assembly protein A